MNMKHLFPGYYRPTDDEFAALWKEATFVFDTNVLLNLYRFQEQTRDKLVDCIEGLSDRIWLPYQVALEYQRNRLVVIAEQKRKFRQVQTAVESNIKKLHDELTDLQLEKRHSIIKVDSLLEEIDSRKNEFLAELTSLESQQRDVNDADPIREAIDRLFDGKIGPAPENQGILEKIYKEGETRYRSKIPPGYGDADKKDSFGHGDFVYHRKFGDLILWKQLLDHVDSQSIKHVVFVTDEEKPDWWWFIDSAGKMQIDKKAGKKLGPRPELVQEILSKTQAESFWIYGSHRFAEYTKKYLGVAVSEESLTEIQDVTTTPPPSPYLSVERELAFVAERTVEEWLVATYGLERVDFIGRGLADFHVNLAGVEQPLAFEAVYVRHLSAMSSRLRDRVFRAADAVMSGQVSAFTFVIVVADEEEVEGAIQRLSSPRFEIPSCVGFAVGFMHESDDGWGLDGVVELPPRGK